MKPLKKFFKSVAGIAFSRLSQLQNHRLITLPIWLITNTLLLSDNVLHAWRMLIVNGIVSQLTSWRFIAGFNVFFDNVPQSPVFIGQISKHLCEPPALVLEIFDLFDAAGLRTTLFCFPGVVADL